MITVDNRQDEFDLQEGWIEKLSSDILHILKLGNFELSISMVGEKEMSELNSKYLGEEGPTDVLAFPLADGIPEEKDILGDVVICPSVVNGDNAEIAKLLVHGVLHLVGYDHYEPSDKKEMFDLQDEILGKITV